MVLQKQTSQSSFSTNNGVKYSSSGGIDVGIHRLP